MSNDSNDSNNRDMVATAIATVTAATTVATTKPPPKSRCRLYFGKTHRHNQCVATFVLLLLAAVACCYHHYQRAPLLSLSLSSSMLFLRSSISSIDRDKDKDMNARKRSQKINSIHDAKDADIKKERSTTTVRRQRTEFTSRQKFLKYCTI